MVILAMEKLLKFLLFLVVPAMVLGQIVSIEVRNFKYEVSASEFLIVVVTVLFIVDRIIKKDLKIHFPVTAFFFACYLFLTAFSVLWANDISRTIIALRVGLYHILIFTVTLNMIKSKKDLRYLFYSFSVAAVLISAQLVYQVYEMDGFFTKFIPERTSIITPVGPWVTVSAIIVFMLPVAYGLGLYYFQRNRTVSITFFSVAAFSALASMVTLGKSELIALVAGMAFFNYKYFNHFRLEYFNGVRLARAAVATAVVAAGVVFVLSPFIQGFTDRFRQTLRDENTKFRVREYQLTFSAVQENFFTGVGAGNLKVYFRNKGLCQCYTEASNYLTHFFGELGIIGFLLFLAGSKSIVGAVHRLKKSTGEDKLITLCFQAALLIFLVNGFFEATLVGLNYGIAFWMMVGGMLAFEKLYSEAGLSNEVSFS